MIIDNEVIEALVQDPIYLTDQDWAELRNIANVFKRSGETDWLKCAVSAYIEWIGLETIKRRQQ